MEEWKTEYPWDEEKNEFCDRECYEFNEKLKVQFDDKCCEHCKKYLTLQCSYLEDFMIEIVDLEDFE
ncbi:MAG: hypothetical protein JSV09_13970 [Thermoplasmata archaeon]|nr:MAG: hypothetical protein JSV09_13970 [Thermoplasmata archaeon]